MCSPFHVLIQGVWFGGRAFAVPVTTVSVSVSVDDLNHTSIRPRPSPSHRPIHSSLQSSRFLCFVPRRWTAFRRRRRTHAAFTMTRPKGVLRGDGLTRTREGAGPTGGRRSGAVPFFRLPWTESMLVPLSGHRWIRGSRSHQRLR